MLDTILEMAQNAKFESKPSFNGRNLIVILVKNTWHHTDNTIIY